VEAEVFHGRLAMLAVVGAFVPEALVSGKPKLKLVASFQIS
jgi:hypothetical protein